MNKKIFCGLVLAVSLCALVGAASGQQPTPRPRRGGLDNLSLPSTSARVAAASTTGAGGWTTFAPEGAGFSISLPAQLVSQPGFADKFFASATEGMTRSLLAENPKIKFQLVAEQSISLDGYEGRELEYAAEGHRAVARVFLIEGSVFGLGVLGAKSDMTPDKVNRFLDSLALTQ